MNHLIRPVILLDENGREVRLRFEEIFCTMCLKTLQFSLRIGTEAWNEADIRWLNNGGPVRDVL